MAEKRGLGGSGNTGPTAAGTGKYDIKTTLPDLILRHEISDEELAMLHHGQSDRAFEVMLAAGGVAGGALPQVIRDVFAAFFADKGVPIDAISFLCILLFGVALGAALLAFVLYRRGESAVDAKVREIRERTNHRMQLVSGKK